MTKNIDRIDRLLRAAIGVALIASAVSLCPAYAQLGVRTCPASRS
jgi:hypothetical protein